MNISLYDITVTPFNTLLGQLTLMLDKAEAHAKSVGYDSALLSQTRLVVDMFPLTRQIQIACDSAKLCISRISGQEAPTHPDQETTLPELKARIQSTLDFINSIPANTINANSERIVEWKTRAGMKSAPALTYINRWAIPNFYFHLTTTYNLLRQQGVPLGKPDFLGNI